MIEIVSYAKTTSHFNNFQLVNSLALAFKSNNLMISSSLCFRLVALG